MVDTARPGQLVTPPTPLGTRGAGWFTAARALIAVGLIGLFVWQSFYDHAADFKSFFSAGYAVRHPEIPLYDLIALDENPFGEVFKLAPPAAVYLVPVSFGTIQRARLVWRIVLVACIVVAFALLAHALGISAISWTWLAGMAAWTQFGPLQIAVGEGQWDPIFILLVVVATVGVMQHRLLLTALAVALAGSIKPYPLVLAGWLLARRQWRALAAVILVSAGLFAVGAAIVGFDETQAFLFRVLPASGATTAYADNQALGGVLARLLTDDLKPFPLRNGIADLLIRLTAAGLVALSIWLVASRPVTSPLDRTLQFSLFVPVSILVIPAAWTHYQAILLVPLTLLAIDQANQRPTDMVGWLLLGGLYAVLLLPNPSMLYGAEIDRNLWLRSRADGANLTLQRLYPDAVSRLVLSYKAFAVAGLYCLLAWRVSRPAALPTEAAS